VKTEHWKKQLVVVALVVVVLILGACGGGSSSDPAETADGKTLLEDRCVQCHDLERTTSKQKTREQWEQTVTAMVQKGTQLSDEEQTVLVDYLAEQYGP
jgi:cytochrome c5